MSEIYDYVIENFGIEVVKKTMEWLPFFRGIDLNGVNPFEINGLRFAIDDEKISIS